MIVSLSLPPLPLDTIANLPLHLTHYVLCTPSPPPSSSPSPSPSCLQYLYTGRVELPVALLADCLRISKQCCLEGEEWQEHTVNAG